MLSSEEIRSRFLRFFEKRGHKIIPSASLVPENDPSVLFTTAGMHPLVPYLLGQTHPMGKRLASVQKCIRTGDLEDIGDNRHFSFFEMLGNWSLGDYFKKDAITWSYQFLTSKEEGLGLDPARLYVTCFEGDENAPRDEESSAVWRSLGIPRERIYFLGADDNWWSPGDSGPCGPCTEMFYDFTEEGLGEIFKEKFLEAVRKENLIEIWNDVFMEYQKKDGKVIGRLSMQNVDTGAGLERITALLQKKRTAYDSDIFKPLMDKIDDLYLINDIRAKRIIADHIRASVFLIADGVRSSNNDRGYVLRRLLRRAIRFVDVFKKKEGNLSNLAGVVIGKYESAYPNLRDQELVIVREIQDEEQRFRKTLQSGLREFKKMSTGKITGYEAFILFSTYGFPFEMTKELAMEAGKEIDENDFMKEMEKHQELSRAGSEQKFKGGLADTSEASVKYHTATHILHASLREVLGDHVLQKGSNITSERLRFDFSHDAKMTDEEIRKVEGMVNKKIEESLPVSFEEMKIGEAKESGALGVFGEKYGEVVRVYKIGDEKSGIFSMELCGGPHIENTSKLGHFKIIKEEAVSAGIRRIKAILD